NSATARRSDAERAAVIEIIDPLSSEASTRSGVIAASAARDGALSIPASWHDAHAARYTEGPSWPETEVAMRKSTTEDAQRMAVLMVGPFVWSASAQSIFTRRRNCWFSLQMNSMISSSGEIC